ncbi:hypothetical protein DFP72DRAFT_1075002 [Ephemerocybe angulata]|uniref:Uncharacterized protein n=1 Tax=Ephemerocybe angulata TaxID=980116 RepID=A0A8H6HJ67_9AGAR|nr:hypothetical protein DFP72DRAFT_1075002 [Tulosesus angulatus]
MPPLPTTRSELRAMRAEVDRVLATESDPQARSKYADEQYERLLDVACARVPIPTMADAPPFNFMPYLELLMVWLWPSYQDLETDEERDEFWELLNGVIDVWDDVPYTEFGESMPVDKRREELINIVKSEIEDHEDIVVPDEKKYIDLPWGGDGYWPCLDRDWRKNFDINIHTTIRMSLYFMSLDPSFRLELLRRERRHQVKCHIAMRTHYVDIGRLEDPCVAGPVGQCDCFKFR